MVSHLLHTEGKRILIKGNQAIAQAAINAGVECYFGYPITPQSEIGEYLSIKLPEMGLTFIPAESELASINMLIGASTVGVKAMTSSSSCGIALMQEAISAMCCQQIPGVIISVMRGGPGLGNIAPAQGDYFQATKGGGNGDYKTIVLSPSTIQEAIDLTYKAFYLTFKYRNPVMLLADGILGQMMEPVYFNKYPYSGIESDVSSWALSGAKNREARNLVSLHMDNLDMTHISNKIFKKYKEFQEKEMMYESFMIEDADIIISAFGIVGRIAKAAVTKARQNGIKVGLFRPIVLSPFPEEILHKLTKNAKVILDIEMNQGQMLYDVRSTVFGNAPVEFYGKAAGDIISDDDVYEKIIEIDKKYVHKAFSK